MQGDDRILRTGQSPLSRSRYLEYSARFKLGLRGIDAMIRRTIPLMASLALLTAMSLSLTPRRAYANKVDCGKVMSEVAAGKKTKDIAAELKISTSSVYRCKKKAATAAKTRPGMTPAPSPTPRSKHTT
jgi:Bacterial regulatory proteins, luxR family